MTETDALTVLRSAAAQFEQPQKLTLAAFLISECNPNFGLKVEQEVALEKAFAASEQFSVAEKLSFAIELLRFCQDEEEDEGDGLPDPSDYEEDDDAIYQFSLAASTAEKIANGEFEED
ncbi:MULTISPECIES: hypothetical protein [unclassified Microcoleus]|uniref:hypothetical protein n=1 Tax=unclassified Microcoleus TaxID=2642155 RepID=UPI002FD3ADD9